MTRVIHTKLDLSRKTYYTNRELSLLEFNRRVLEQANDKTIPLLERLKFLCICSSNLDEFFEIRVAGLKHQLAFGTASSHTDGIPIHELLKKIKKQTQQLIDEQYRIFNQDLLPALNKESINFIAAKDWTNEQAEWIKNYFNEDILPIVSPIGLDLAHPLPRLINKSLNFIVALEGKDAFGRKSNLAIVHAPRSLPRAIRLPAKLCSAEYSFIFLSSIIETHIHELFPGMVVTGCYQFRLTRDSDLLFDGEIEDLALAVKDKLQSRRYGKEVRLEIAHNCPAALSEFLLKKHNLNHEALYLIDGPVNLSRLMKIIDVIERPDLKYPTFVPSIPKRLQNYPDIFTAIRHHDILLHHPYHSFNCVLDLIRQATGDPCVLAIKQTLYRTGADSLMARALADAARAGKEVTAVIELRARFDEEHNLELANRLQEAGVLVVYGVVGFKTHAKMTLIVRREENHLRNYCHLGTGNYHAGTARQYTDYGLLTADPILGDDVQKLFQQLTGMSKVIKLKKILHAPFTLYKSLSELITNEIIAAKSGKTGHIIAKMNALTDPQIIQALYQASQAGVKIELIIRGICSLRPGILGVSENITVRSIVGRFLEHERIFYFYNGGKEKIYCASADWMERNFYHRIEICFPIEDPKLAKQIKKHSLQTYLKDNTQSWELQADGSYQRNQAGKQKIISAQQALLEKYNIRIHKTLVLHPLETKQEKPKRKLKKAGNM